jgi:hypothetical protein
VAAVPGDVSPTPLKEKKRGCQVKSDWKERPVVGFGTSLSSVSGLVKLASFVIRSLHRMFLGQYNERRKFRRHETKA